jgi:hypothetical protein
MQIKTVDIRLSKKILTCANTSCSGNYEFTGEIEVVANPDVTAPGVHVFAHKCSVCADEQIFEQKFPSMIYIDIPGTEKDYP